MVLPFLSMLALWVHFLTYIWIISTKWTKCIDFLGVGEYNEEKRNFVIIPDLSEKGNGRIYSFKSRRLNQNQAFMQKKVHKCLIFLYFCINILCKIAFWGWFGEQFGEQNHFHSFNFLASFKRYSSERSRYAFVNAPPECPTNSSLAGWETPYSSQRV